MMDCERWWIHVVSYFAFQRAGGRHQTFGAGLDRSYPPYHNNSCYTLLRRSTLRSRFSLVKMLLPAVVSIAFLAVLGQGQTSKSRFHKTLLDLSASSQHYSPSRGPLHIFSPTAKCLHSTSSRSSKRRPPSSLVHLRLHSHDRDDRLHQPNLPDSSSSPRMFRRHVPDSRRQSLHR